MNGGEGLVREQVTAFRILSENSVGDVVGHGAEDIALQSQLFLRLRVQRKDAVKPARQIIRAHDRGNGPRADRHGLIHGGGEMGKQEMLQPFENRQARGDRKGQPHETRPIGAEPGTRRGLNIR